MSASRGPRLSALWLMLMGTMTVGLARPAGAQFLGNDALPLFPDPITRSTRLLGMGNLTLADDRNNRLTLWDFARNPVGLAESDSVSEIELWPGAQSAEAQRDLVANDPDRIRQLADARGRGIAYEMFHRSRHGMAYGARGTFGTRSVDQLYDQETGVDQKFTAPDVEVILNGAMPRIGESMHWSMRGTFGRQDIENRFHTIEKNPAGEFVGITGDRVNPPDFFTPDAYTITTNGVGLGLSYRTGPWLTATAGADFLTMKIDGENSDVRHFSGTGESRPYRVYQSTAMGRIGSKFEWIADGRAWRAQNEQTWVFTLAAGIQQDPLTGRGFMYQRREEGSSLRTRARYALGDLKLGGSFETGYGKVEITGPRNDDYTSFNYFLNTLNYRQNADSLTLPDSVRSDVAYQRDVGFALGATYPVSWHHGLVGAEYHHFRGAHDQLITGTGPRQETWDVRAGFEVPCTNVLTGRVGFIHRSNDADTFTAQNETIGNTVTAGLGVLHPGARWSLQASYGFEWLAVDYPDPYESHGGGHQFGLNLRWAF